MTTSDSGKTNCIIVILSSTALDGSGVPRLSTHSVVTAPIYSTGVIIVPEILIFVILIYFSRCTVCYIELYRCYQN